MEFTSSPTPSDGADVVIVGAGIIGLAHAVEARRRGQSVIVVDRDTMAVGASVRNFGHCCVTAQDGDLLDLAMISREGWLRTIEAADLWSNRDGAVVLARTPTELGVLEELAAKRPDDVRVLTGAQTRDVLGGDASRDVTGGGHLVHDLRVDPRHAVADIAAWLLHQGVAFRWRTNALGFSDDVVHTNRGDIAAGRVLVCVGHDLDHLAAEVADDHEVLRCRLSMARVQPATAMSIGPAVLTATSMLRYPAFTAMPSASDLRAEVEDSDPGLIDIAANVMFTQLPDGSLVIGDSHHHDQTAAPFLDEEITDQLLARVGDYLGRHDLSVTERWQGVYASSEVAPVLVADLAPGVTAISVTSGVGMTLSFGLAHRTFDHLTFDHLT